MSAVKGPLDIMNEHAATMLEHARKLVINNENLRRNEVELLKHLTTAEAVITESRSEIDRLRKLVEQRDAMISELREMKNPTKGQANK